MTTRAELKAKWTARVSEGRLLNALVPLERVAAEVLADLMRVDEVENDVLSIREAAGASGYAEDTLRRMVAYGQVPNSGRKNKPAIRRSDLPRKPGHALALSLRSEDDQFSGRRRIVLDAKTRTASEGARNGNEST